jgi:hypothetical protein
MVTQQNDPEQSNGLVRFIHYVCQKIIIFMINFIQLTSE